MLKFKNLTKYYGDFCALDHLDTELDYGIYALLGPNGAGKSTMMKILVGLISQTEGYIFYNGTDVEKMDRKFQELIGYMPQYPGFYPSFSAEELMWYMAEMKGYSRKEYKNRCDELLHSVNLYNNRKAKIGTFSGGMRQRLGLAQALINNPKILILDEPTAGLDPKERVRFRNMIRRLSDRIIVIFCTHIVSDIETIAKEILLIHHGKLIKKETIPNLISEMNGKVWEIAANPDELEKLIDQFPRSSFISRNMQTIVRVVNDEQPHPKAEACQPILEDVYLYLFGDMS